jgi:hypothetical protein
VSNVHSPLTSPSRPLTLFRHSLRSVGIVDSGAQAGKSVRAWHAARHQIRANHHSVSVRSYKNSSATQREHRNTANRVRITSLAVHQHHRTHTAAKGNRTGQGIPPRRKRLTGVPPQPPSVATLRLWAVETEGRRDRGIKSGDGAIFRGDVRGVVLPCLKNDSMAF